MFNVEPKAVVDAHILICNPNEREEGKKVPAPVREKKFVPRYGKECCRDIMTEAVFAGKEIKELAPKQASGLYGFLMAILPRFTKDFLMGNGPCDTGNWDCQNQQPRDLNPQSH